MVIIYPRRRRRIFRELFLKLLVLAALLFIAAVAAFLLIPVAVERAEIPENLNLQTLAKFLKDVIDYWLSLIKDIAAPR